MEKTMDPRFLRTRQLIMNSFMQLTIEKEFKDITIKDITTRATVNRATFYYHFFDKYDLLEKVLAEDVLKGVLTNVNSHEALTPESMKNIFTSILQFQTGLANQCARSYEAFTPKIETIVKEELARIFRDFLKDQHPDWPFEKVDLESIMLSWSLYGMSTKYVKSGEIPTEEMIHRLFKKLMA